MAKSRTNPLHRLVERLVDDINRITMEDFFDSAIALSEGEAAEMASGLVIIDTFVKRAIVLSSPQLTTLASHHADDPPPPLTFEEAAVLVIDPEPTDPGEEDHGLWTEQAVRDIFELCERAVRDLTIRSKRAAH